MPGKYKPLNQSTANLTKDKQHAKYMAELIGNDGLDKLQVTPPNHLEPMAKQEYKRIIKSLGSLPLRNLDRAELEEYCTWYSTYKRLSQAMGKAIRENDTETYLSYITPLSKATQAIKGLATDLGLNVNSRMSMNMPKDEKQKPKSIMDQFG